MDFNEYQKKAHLTAQYPTEIYMETDSSKTHVEFPNLSWIYPALGLAGESGELLNKLKKVIRDKNGEINDTILAELASELGDILWYIAELSRQFMFDLDEIATMNIQKLSKRAKNNKIKGSGDNR